MSDDCKCDHATYRLGSCDRPATWRAVYPNGKVYNLCRYHVGSERHRAGETRATITKISKGELA